MIRNLEIPVVDRTFEARNAENEQQVLIVGEKEENEIVEDDWHLLITIIFHSKWRTCPSPEFCRSIIQSAPSKSNPGVITIQEHRSAFLIALPVLKG